MGINGTAQSQPTRSQHSKSPNPPYMSYVDSLISIIVYAQLNHDLDKHIGPTRRADTYRYIYIYICIYIYMYIYIYITLKP